MGAPLRADAERNRQRLLASARELFTTLGLDVTLDEVARHAGVGVGTAYRNFDNKDVLIDALLVDRMDEMVAIAVSCLDHPDPWLGLRGFIEQSLALQVADRGLKQLLFARGRAHTRVEKAREGLAPAVSELVSRAQQAGVVRPDVSASDIPIISIMVGTCIDFSRDREPDLYRRYLEMLLTGLRTDAPVPPEPALDPDTFEEAMARWHSR